MGLRQQVESRNTTRLVIAVEVGELMPVRRADHAEPQRVDQLGANVLEMAQVRQLPRVTARGVNQPFGPRLQDGRGRRGSVLARGACLLRAETLHGPDSAKSEAPPKALPRQNVATGQRPLKSATQIAVENVRSISLRCNSNTLVEFARILKNRYSPTKSGKCRRRERVSLALQFLVEELEHRLVGDFGIMAFEAMASAGEREQVGLDR
jgi:hypothetical protein